MTAQISTQEQTSRQRAIDFARGSVRYEGLVLSYEAEQIGERFVAGLLTITEYVAAIKTLNNLGGQRPEVATINLSG